MALINETMATRFWSGEDPVGQKITFAFRSGPAVAREIVGIVGDVRHAGLPGAPLPEVFLPLLQNPFGSMTLVVRSTGDPGVLIPAARAALWAVDKDMVIYSMAPMNQLISDSLGQRRFILLLLGFFAGMGLLLASLAIHGVVNLLTLRRTREIGIRMALGAARLAILGMVVRQALALTLLGLGLGLAGAWAVTRYLEGLLSPATFPPGARRKWIP